MLDDAERHESNHDILEAVDGLNDLKEENKVDASSRDGWIPQGLLREAVQDGGDSAGNHPDHNGGPDDEGPSAKCPRNKKDPVVEAKDAEFCKANRRHRKDGLDIEGLFRHSAVLSRGEGLPDLP